MSNNKVWPLISALALTGCGTIPDVTVSYYFPRAKTQLAVTQTIGCSPKSNNTHRIIRSVISVAPTSTYSADLDWLNKDGQPYQGQLHYGAFKGLLSDADATVTMTPDGRLLTINGSSTGQGDAVIKSLITFIGAVALLGPRATGPFIPTVEDKACEQVDTFSVVPSAAGDAKGAALVTLTYNVTITYSVVTGAQPNFAVDTVSSPGYDNQSGDRASITFVPDPASKPSYEALHSVLAERMDTTLQMVSTKDSVRYLNSTVPTTVASGTPLELNKVALVNLKVQGHAGDLLQASQIWAGFVPVPMRETYKVPIPSPQMFGKTMFGIGLSDYGSIISLHYGSANGASDAADAAGAIAKALQPKSPEDRANELKGEADLIAQQQRLITCQVSPTTCK
jgi:hypothetical protein